MSVMKTQFDTGLCDTPSPGGNHEGLSGGFPIEDVGPGGKGLVSSPYTDGICGSVNGKETPSRELGTTPTLFNVKDAPAGQYSGASDIGKMTQTTPDSTFKPGK